MERNDWHCMERNGWHSLERYSQVSNYDTKDDDIEDRLLTEVRVERLKKILEEIPIDDRSILMMKYMDSMSIKDIGGITNKSDSAVKMKIKRAKQRFIKVHDKHYKAMEV